MRRPSSDSLREYGRGLAGGFFFSLPLIYTMEMWWAGFNAGPGRLLFFLVATFTLLLGYNYYAGIRHDADWTDVVVDSVEELGLGLVTAAGLLFLLGRITLDMSAHEVFGRIVIEAGVVAIGFSVGSAQLGADGEDRGSGRRRGDAGLAGHIVIAFCGAVLISANVAPTEEIVILSAEAGPFRLFGIMLLSLLMAQLILFYGGFESAARVARADSTGHAIAIAIVTCAIAAVSSAVMLWFFGRFQDVGLGMVVAQTIVLSFPATLGASAGRVLLQP